MRSSDPSRRAARRWSTTVVVPLSSAHRGDARRGRDRPLIQRAVQAPPDAPQDLDEVSRRVQAVHPARERGIGVGVRADVPRDDEAAGAVDDRVAVADRRQRRDGEHATVVDDDRSGPDDRWMERRDDRGAGQDVLMAPTSWSPRASPPSPGPGLRDAGLPGLPIRCRRQVGEARHGRAGRRRVTHRQAGPADAVGAVERRGDGGAVGTRTASPTPRAQRTLRLSFLHEDDVHGRHPGGRDDAERDLSVSVTGIPSRTTYSSLGAWPRPMWTPPTTWPSSSVRRGRGRRHGRR